MLPHKIVITGESRIELVDIESILYIVADVYGAVIYMEDRQRLCCNKTLCFFEQYLPDFFFRINRNTIISIPHIIKINKSSREIILKGEIVLSPSIRKLRELTNHLSINVIQ